MNTALYLRKELTLVDSQRVNSKGTTEIFKQIDAGPTLREA